VKSLGIVTLMEHASVKLAGTVKSSCTLVNIPIVVDPARIALGLIRIAGSVAVTVMVASSQMPPDDVSVI
jgi:hypothetical protein